MLLAFVDVGVAFLNKAPGVGKVFSGVTGFTHHHHHNSMNQIMLTGMMLCKLVFDCLDLEDAGRKLV
jgi:hypothetical protein